MKDPGGNWLGYGLGDVDPKVSLMKRLLLAKFTWVKNYQPPLVVSDTYDETFAAVVSQMQANYKIPVNGIMNAATQTKCGFYVPLPPEPVCVYFSINGAGSTWNMGYPFDIGETLDKSKCWHQPIGYNTNPFPMSKGVKDGVQEFIRQLDMPRGRAGKNCTQLPWTYNFYSMGAIVGMTVLMRVLYGDLQRFKATCMGGSTFGNPMRQQDHTFPGCTWSDGEGIVTPTAHDCPVEHWDFACDKAMPGGGGDDLYTKIAKDGVSTGQDIDMRAVWDIVNTGNPLNLAEAILMLLAKPSFTGGFDAAKAAFQALGFFVIKGTGPHVKYQLTQPIDGDPRDCWELAREHAADLVARLPQPNAVPQAA